MSLDVYLRGPEYETACFCCECGHEHKHTKRDELYSSNITHNLNKMAEAAGIYQPLWRPEEIGITKASQLIQPLTDGLEKLESDQEHYEQFNAPNGWGMYKNFVPWVREYLDACKRYPDANVYACR